MAYRRCKIFLGAFIGLGFFMFVAPLNAGDEKLDMIDVNNSDPHDPLLEQQDCRDNWSCFFCSEKLHSYFSNPGRRQLVLFLLLLKTGLDIATVVFLVEQMHSIKDLQKILARSENEHCDLSCLEELRLLLHRADSAYLTDAISGITFSLLASISDLVALRAYVYDSKKTLFRSFMVSSVFNVVTLFSTSIANLNLWNVKKEVFYELSTEAKEALNKVIGDGAKILAPTLVEIIPPSLILWDRYCKRD